MQLLKLAEKVVHEFWVYWLIDLYLIRQYVCPRLKSQSENWVWNQIMFPTQSKQKKAAQYSDVIFCYCIFSVFATHPDIIVILESFLYVI